MIDVIDRFLYQVESNPDQIAVVDQNRTLTYREMALLSKRYAAAIHNIKPQPRVLILLPQGVEAYAAMLGTLIAGGYYCPVNIDLPKMRIQQILEQFNPDLIACRRKDLELITNSKSLPAVTPEELPSEINEFRHHSHKLIYVIFTSGSTGQPKGVIIRRKAFSKFIEWAVEATQARVGDRWAQFSNIGFDLSAVDIYTSLGTGATLVAINSPKDRLMPALAIRKHGVTIWHSVPSVIDLMSQAKQVTPENLRTLRLMSFCGEPLLPQHMDTLFAANPHMTIFNTYGPTEGTVFCTYIALQPNNYQRACNKTVAIGKPIPGWHIALRGGDRPDEGEIVVYGEYIGVGYWRNPEATHKSYRTIQIGDRMYPAYYTGDWAERRGEHLFFRRRMDYQAKVHGFRVELDEVDYYVRAFGVPNSCSMVVDDRLYCFIESSSPISTHELREFLIQRLPYYSVPSEFFVRSQLPRNQNQKINRGYLRQQIEESKG